MAGSRLGLCKVPLSGELPGNAVYNGVQNNAYHKGDTMAYLFGDLPKAATPQVGGKASSRARLYQRRYPVPAGLVIPVTGFAGDDLKPEEWRQVQEWLTVMRRKSPEMTFAVRSSALAEDSTQVSFAGEFES